MIKFGKVNKYNKCIKEIDSSNKEFAEQKFEMFKKVVDDLRGKIKGKYKNINSTQKNKH